LLGIGFTELAIILIVAFLIFGPKKLPDVARSLGKAMYQLKHASNSFTQELSKEWHRLEVDVPEKGDGGNGSETKDGDKGV
jgi:TatA/E family protein of Tat protein translocase